ncbi:MAG TPA: hypothetical protein VE869_09335 [Gemmatimonas sp.]|nr:hypothetical protein [Gemmatimonas sp.]
MYMSTTSGQFAEELADLHDGSVSLFVTLPIFRELMSSPHIASALARIEGVIGEHLAHLDCLRDETAIRRERRDSDLTRSLFRALSIVRSRPASRERDAQILEIVEQAQLFLMGSCGFALRFARQAGVDRSVHVLERSLEQIRSLAGDFPAVGPDGAFVPLAANAVA